MLDRDTSTNFLEQEITVGLSDDVDIDRFLANPSEYFGHSLTRMMGLSREQLDRLQIAALKHRFAQFRDTLPMLRKLADVLNISAIDTIDDVLPLLFDHTTYKSYPASFLEKHRYAQLSAWLNKLTTIDLTKVDVSECRSIDDWIIALTRETPLAVMHTSGTSGSLSFLPWTKADWIKVLEQIATVCFQSFGESAPVRRLPLEIDCIYPFFRSGGLSHTVINDAIVEVIAGSEERFHAAYPQRLSADMMLLASRQRAAAAKGQLDQLVIDPALAARREEFEAQQREMPHYLERFFTTMRTELAGQRIFMISASHMLYSLAENGLKQGMRKVFSADSVIYSGGGGKGMVLPDHWEDSVKEFFGTEKLVVVYGMSEMSGQFCMCEAGHYHQPPWVISFILNPDTGEPLPRAGTTTGRFAFYDLLPETRWGGFVSGDEVTMVWDTPCACGRTTPYLEGKIRRLSEIRSSEGEEKLSCAAAPAAYAEALDFLNDTSV